MKLIKSIQVKFSRLLNDDETEEFVKLQLH